MQDVNARVLACEPLAEELTRLILHAPEIAARCDRILHIRDGQVQPEGETGP